MLSNIFWAILGGGIGQGLNMISGWISIRLLGQEAFGKYGIVTNTVGTFGILAGLGIGVMSTKYIAQYRDIDAERTGRIIGFSIAISLISGFLISSILALFSKPLANNLLNTANLILVLRIGCVLLFFETLNGVLLGIISGFEGFKQISLILLLRGIIGIPLMYFFIIKFGIEGALVSKVTVSLLAYITSCYFVENILKRKSIIISYKFNVTESLHLLNFSVPSLLAQSLNIFIFWIVNLMMINLRGGYTQMAIYNVAYQFQTIITFISGSINTSILPLLSNLLGKKTYQTFIKVIRLNIFVSGSIAFVIAIPFIIFAKSIMGIYGEEYINSFPVLICISITSVLMTTNSVIGNSFISSGKMWWGFVMNLIWGITVIILAYFLVKDGAWGLGLIFLISYTLHLLWQSIIFWKLILPKFSR
ncbi:MAG: oligosaccharide flippase family protein [Chloroflexi bacterium]|nr:oligosaccharide flippase family protein [Chloroflexota bacterium]